VLVAGALLGPLNGAWGQVLVAPGDVQAVVPSPTPRTFGTANSTTHVIYATEFEPRSNTSSYDYNADRKFSAGVLIAGVRLPAGALIQSIELEGCDFNAVSELSFALRRRASPPVASPILVTPVGVTGVAESPGCAFFSVAPLSQAGPLVIDNENNTYFLEVGAPNAGTIFAAVRVYYTLQVSPAPAVATFSDVPPSHPFFRFIEALVASGITAGCGGGNFCPDTPLTRGQMAVFLAIGLGLHFAP
jgi:hypothetical protein